MALLHRRPAKGLIHHSDRASNTPAMTIRPCCRTKHPVLDESSRQLLRQRDDGKFWGSYKQELVYQQPNGRFISFAQARTKSFQYIEIFYNRKRRHSSIGYQSPEQSRPASIDAAAAPAEWGQGQTVRL